MLVNGIAKMTSLNVGNRVRFVYNDVERIGNIVFVKNGGDGRPVYFKLENNDNVVKTFSLEKVRGHIVVEN